jgi:hypothetical protein
MAFLQTNFPALRPILLPSLRVHRFSVTKTLNYYFCGATAGEGAGTSLLGTGRAKVFAGGWPRAT